MSNEVVRKAWGDKIGGEKWVPGVHKGNTIDNWYLIKKAFIMGFFTRIATNISMNEKPLRNPLTGLIISGAFYVGGRAMYHRALKIDKNNLDAIKLIRQRRVERGMSYNDELGWHFRDRPHRTPESSKLPFRNPLKQPLIRPIEIDPTAI